MATIIVRHKVGDFDAWLKGHQERLSLFSPAISGFKTFQDANDPKSVALVMEVNDMQKLAAIINDPRNEDARNRHTVLDPIVISTQVDL